MKMKIDQSDLDDFDYLIVHKEEDGSISMQTVSEDSFKLIYRILDRHDRILRVFKKVHDSELYYLSVL